MDGIIEMPDGTRLIRDSCFVDYVAPAGPNQLERENLALEALTDYEAVDVDGVAYWRHR